MGLFRSLLKPILRASHYVGADAWLKFLSPVSTALNRSIGKDEALTVASFWRGINVLANTIAALPLDVFDKLPGGGKEPNDVHPLYWILKYKPNDLQDPFQFVQMMIVHLVLKGDFICQKIYNGRLEVDSLWPLNPDNVEIDWSDKTDEKSLEYRVTLPSGKRYVLPKEKVFHVRSLATDGFRGLSLVRLAAQSIGIAIAQEEHTASFFGRGTRATGVLEHPNKLTAEAAGRITSSFQANFSGSENAYKTILLEEGMKWNQVSMDAEKSQLTQSREMTVAEFARWLGVPPHLLYDLRRATFSNIEQQNLEFYQNSIQPWLKAIEAAMTRQLLKEKTEWGKVIIEFNINGILRSDITSRYAAYAIGRNTGFLCVDEIRAKENMNPLPGGKGKIYLEPLNMKEVGKDPVEEVDDEEEPTAQQDNGATENPPAQQDKEKKAWNMIFKSRVERALRREVSMRERDNFDELKLREYLVSDFRTDAEAYHLFTRGIETGEAAGQVTESFAEIYLQTKEKCADTLTATLMNLIEGAPHHVV